MFVLAIHRYGDCTQPTVPLKGTRPTRKGVDSSDPLYFQIKNDGGKPMLVFLD